jgi:hypothetical protein
MSKNILYNFIAHKIFKTGTLPSGIKLTQKTHTKGTLYYFFELPKDDAVVGEYTLDNHHVSVFAESNGYLDGKSQYHYTAYMKDKEGNRYRLHVYFNPRDGYVSVPLLSLIADDGSFIPVADSEDNHEVFKALAHLSIDTLIAQLRKDQKELVKKLKQEYDVLEKEATELSKNLESNKEAYKDNLDLQIAKLEELSNYTDSDPYLYQLAFLKRQKKSPELQILSSGTGHLESKENKESSTTKESSHVETEIATPDSDGRVVTNKAGLSEEIVELSKQFEHIKTLKDDKLAVALTALNTSLLDLELTGTLLKDLQSLRALRKQLDVKASTTLQNLLLSGKFNEAAALSSFYKLVP